MPRKVSYGVDFDENYDVYDDYHEDNYDYNYANGIDEHESAWDSPEIKHKIVTKQEIVRQNVWHCPICTYDNEEYVSACDICDVLRNPLVKSSNNGQSSKVAPNVNKSSTSDAHSTKPMNNVNLKSTTHSSDNSLSAISKDKFQHVEENNHAPKSDKQTHIISKELNNMTMNPKISDKRMLVDQAEDRLTQLNLAIVGHVDSGKSTISGRLLHLLGQISHKQMHKFEKEAKLQGKRSFAYAWALDESSEERERGITMTVAVAYFNLNKYHAVVLDSPGHKDFVPNMISGATQADAALLVIDASLGAFEAGIDSPGGQTREHAQLIRSFGVDQIIVSVNKMDAVEYSKERFDSVKLQLGTFLRSCNFKDSSVLWVPFSALENQNLVGPASDYTFF